MKPLSTIALIIYFFIFSIATAIAADNASKIDPDLELIHALGCKGCHTINGEGGSLAADLTKIGTRMSVKQIKAQLIAEPATRTKGFMPSYSSLPDKDLTSISEYLYNLP